MCCIICRYIDLGKFPTNEMTFRPKGHSRASAVVDCFIHMAADVLNIIAKKSYFYISMQLRAELLADET